MRATGEAVRYDRAGQAFEAALRRDPNQMDALIGQGMLALARHDFKGALAWANQA